MKTILVFIAMLAPLALAIAGCRTPDGSGAGCYYLGLCARAAPVSALHQEIVRDECREFRDGRCMGFTHPRANPCTDPAGAARQLTAANPGMDDATLYQALVLGQETYGCRAPAPVAVPAPPMTTRCNWEGYGVSGGTGGASFLVMRLKRSQKRDGALALARTEPAEDSEDYSFGLAARGVVVLEQGVGGDTERPGDLLELPERNRYRARLPFLQGLR